MRSLSLYARMALILTLGLVCAQGIGFLLQNNERSAQIEQARGQGFLDKIVQAIQLLEATAPAGRAGAAQALARVGIDAQAVDAAALYPHAPRGAWAEMLAQRLGSARAVRSKGAGPGAGMGGAGGGFGPGLAGGAVRSLDVQLSDGQWMRLTERKASAQIPALATPVLIQLGLTLLLVAGATLLAVRQATQPLAQLARAAERLGRDLNAPPLPEHGSPEMRHAAHAFNTMQQRIRSLMQERERALAAVSHDLRTPLTRLRLRVDMVEDDALREQLDQDIAAMAALIDTTLGYLRERNAQDAPRPLDVNALLDSLIDDAAVQGRTVARQGQAQDFYPGRLSGLRRALQNLIDNAFKYGARTVTLRVQDDAAELRLCVCDDGPGIAEQDLDRVTEPYYRADTARTRADGSVGLGLSIVRDVAQSHGGSLRLHNRPEGGLSACLHLPRPRPNPRH
ncbi:MAG: hypothetical protein OHK0048_24560 [Rhodoferax sp.]